MSTGDDLPPTEVLPTRYDDPPRRCPKCGTLVPRGAQHCPACGHELQPRDTRPLWAIGVGAFVAGLLIAFLIFGVGGVGQTTKTVTDTTPAVTTQTNHVSVTTPTETVTSTETHTQTETQTQTVTTPPKTVTTPPVTQTVTITGSGGTSP